MSYEYEVKIDDTLMEVNFDEQDNINDTDIVAVIEKIKEYSTLVFGDVDNLAKATIVGRIIGRLDRDTRLNMNVGILKDVVNKLQNHQDDEELNKMFEVFFVKSTKVGNSSVYNTFLDELSDERLVEYINHYKTIEYAVRGHAELSSRMVRVKDKDVLKSDVYNFCIFKGDYNTEEYHGHLDNVLYNSLSLYMQNKVVNEMKVKFLSHIPSRSDYELSDEDIKIFKYLESEKIRFSESIVLQLRKYDLNITSSFESILSKEDINKHMVLDLFYQHPWYLEDGLFSTMNSGDFDQINVLGGNLEMVFSDVFSDDDGSYESHGHLRYQAASRVNPIILPSYEQYTNLLNDGKHHNLLLQLVKYMPKAHMLSYFLNFPAPVDSGHGLYLKSNRMDQVYTAVAKLDALFDNTSSMDDFKNVNLEHLSMGERTYVKDLVHDHVNILHDGLDVYHELKNHNMPTQQLEEMVDIRKLVDESSEILEDMRTNQLGTQIVLVILVFILLVIVAAKAFM